MITLIFALIGAVLDLIIIGGIAVFIICSPFILIRKIFDLVETRIIMGKGR